MNVLFISKYHYDQVFDIDGIEAQVQKAAKELGYSFTSTKMLFDKNKEPVDFYKDMENAKKKADIIITEISHNSSGVGHDVMWAMINRKPTLMIYDNTMPEIASPLLMNKAKTERLLEAKGYSKIEDIDGIVKKFLQDAKKLSDTKFILIISPEIDKYLEWAAQERRQHKAQIVRESIETVMGKDREYQQFLKDHDLV